LRTFSYEYILPTSIFVDSSEWQPIAAVRDGFPMRLHKPVCGDKHIAPLAGTRGNEGLVVQYSVFRVDVDVEEGRDKPEWLAPLAMIQECLSWIRVVAGQYWVGVLMSPTENLARGSVFDESGAWTNFAGTQTPIMVNKPLDNELWQWIGLQLATSRRPPIPALLCSDAMLSLREHDYMQTVIRLGVTCELELNAFIDDLLTRQPAAVNKLYEASRLPFAWKLKHLPQLLGAVRYQDRNPRWFAELCKLYDLRGTAVHRAECLLEEIDPATGKKARVPVDFRHASNFLFGVQDFLRWTNSERVRLGLLSG